MIIRTKNEHGWNMAILGCECGLHEHVMWFTDITDKDQQYPEVSLDIHLTPDCGIFKRIWSAIKYIFGFRSKYGDFDEILLDYASMKELQMFCTDFLIKYYDKEKGRL